jgi:diguanylate cyclase (GGDEF)-like protein
MSKDGTANWEFSPYAQLIAALLPRAGGLSVFGPDGEVCWTSETSISPVLPPMIVRSVRVAAGNPEAGERVQLGMGQPAYLFWLRNSGGAVVWVLAISWRVEEADARSFAYVHEILKPVLATLARELALRAQLAGQVQPTQSDSEDHSLRVLLATSEPAPQNDAADDGVEQLLRNINYHLRCEFAAVVVPERKLVVVVKAEGRDPDTSMLARVHRQLLALAQVQGTNAMLLNEPDSLPGMELPFRVLASPLRTPAGRLAGVLALFRAHTEPAFGQRDGLLAHLLARRAAEVVESSYDALSGVFNRRAFEQRARTLLAARADGRAAPWSCLYLDTDRMHVINDNYGMPLGDRLIAWLGGLIRARLVPGALAARISGDRFAILLPTVEEDAFRFAEALRAGVETLTVMHLGGVADTNFRASVSIGVAGFTGQQMDLAHVLAMAETACKAAKDRGRNRVELYQASDLSIMRRYEDVNIAPRLRTALQEGRARLDAQLIAPMSDNGSQRPHYELLLRMIDDHGETVGPARFLSAAIRYQLMPEVDRWVIKETLRLLGAEAKLLAGGPVVFTVNISGQSLGDEDFVDQLIAQIRASGIDPRVLCFELTETAAIANLPRAESMMKRLRELGCSIALDDFGTGLSSLAYLRALPIDMLKIDGSFVRDVLKDPRAESMVQAIAHLARAMQLTTVAEYVETDEIRERVARLGVDYGQGFAIAKPVPLTDALSDLPALLAAAKQSGSERELGPQDETMRADPSAGGFPEVLSERDVQTRMERILAGYDDGEAALYQAQAAG